MWNKEPTRSILTFNKEKIALGAIFFILILKKELTKTMEYDKIILF